MRDPQELERKYHGHKVVSIQNTEPHPDGDGWNHTVYAEDETLVGTFQELSDAIQCAKRAKHPGKYLDASSEPYEIMNEIDVKETDTPETEEK